MYIIILVYHTENRHRHRMNFTNLYIAAATNVFSWANYQLCKNNFETHSYLKYRYITTHK